MVFVFNEIKKWLFCGNTVMLSRPAYPGAASVAVSQRHGPAVYMSSLSVEMMHTVSERSVEKNQRSDIIKIQVYICGTIEQGGQPEIDSPFFVSA